MTVWCYKAILLYVYHSGKAFLFIVKIQATDLSGVQELKPSEITQWWIW